MRSAVVEIPSDKLRNRENIIGTIEIEFQYSDDDEREALKIFNQILNLRDCLHCDAPTLIVHQL